TFVVQPYSQRSQAAPVCLNSSAESRRSEVSIVLCAPILEKAGWCDHDQWRFWNKPRCHSFAQPSKEGQSLERLAKSHIVGQQHTGATCLPGLLQPNEPFRLVRL